MNGFSFVMRLNSQHYTEVDHKSRNTFMDLYSVSCKKPIYSVLSEIESVEIILPYDQFGRADVSLYNLKRQLNMLISDDVKPWITHIELPIPIKMGDIIYYKGDKYAKIMVKALRKAY